MRSTGTSQSQIAMQGRVRAIESHGVSRWPGYAGVKPLSATILPMTLSHALLSEAMRTVPRLRVFERSRASDAAAEVNDTCRHAARMV